MRHIKQHYIIELYLNTEPVRNSYLSFNRHVTLRMITGLATLKRFQKRK